MIHPKKLMVLFATVLTTLNDEGGGAPNGVLYAVLMGAQFGIPGVPDGLSIDEWTAVLGRMKASGMVTERNHYLTLTPEGKSKAIEIEAALRK